MLQGLPQNEDRTEERTVRGNLALAVVLLALVLVATGCSGGAPATMTAGSGPVDIKLTDFAFSPGVVRLQTGREVSFALTNDGKIEHEFMVGRQRASMGGYEQDLFAGVHVRASGEGYALETPGEAAGQSESHGTMELERGANMAHGGTELLLRPGGRAIATFTIPAEKAGEWEIGCFLPGHYEAGMKGVLIVS